jgi:mannonate dehydratase
VKITHAKVLVCCPGRKFLTLKIYNDEGVFGLAYATLLGRELPVGSFLTHVIPCLIGRDPFQTEDLWQYFYRGAYWRGGPGDDDRNRRGLAGRSGCGIAEGISHRSPA